MNQEAPRKKKRGFFSRLFPRTPEGRLAWLTALILGIALIAVWVALWLGGDNVPFQHAMTPLYIAFEVLLALIVIPLLVYIAAKPFDGFQAGAYPDIDIAWDLGIEALEGVGVPVRDLPLFLMLGSSGSEHERALMNATSLSFRVGGIPTGADIHYSLHWYVSSEAIYLFCTDVGMTGEVVQDWSLRPPRDAWGGGGRPVAAAQPSPAVAPSPQRSAPEFYGTVDPQDINVSAANLAAAPGKSQPSPARPTRAGSPPPHSGSSATVTPEDMDFSLPQRTASPGTYQSEEPAAPSPAPAAEARSSQQSERLKYLCRVLRKARHPYCGANGILVLVPFEIARAGSSSMSHMADAIRNDVAAINSELRLRAPTTAMVVGLDQDAGFGELVQRLNPDHRARRLGGRFDLSSRPAPQPLNDHSDQICDAFEDWIYLLFKQPEAIAQQRGNRKLFEFLSRIRHRLKPRLRFLIGRAFGCEANGVNDEPFFFSGCYFASTGADDGRPAAFVNGVIADKLVREQAHVEWNRVARKRQKMTRVAGLVGWIVLLLLVALLVTQIVMG